MPVSIRGLTKPACRASLELVSHQNKNVQTKKLRGYGTTVTVTKEERSPRGGGLAGSLDGSKP